MARQTTTNSVINEHKRQKCYKYHLIFTQHKHTIKNTKMSGKIIKFAPRQVAVTMQTGGSAPTRSFAAGGVRYGKFSFRVCWAQQTRYLGAFLDDRELLDRYHVTEEELGTLKTFAPFGTLTGSDDIIYILERIRRSRRRW